jgi:hypothetical protein
MLLYMNPNVLFCAKVGGYGVILTYYIPSSKKFSALIGWLLARVVFLHNIPFLHDLVYKVACFFETPIRIYRNIKCHISEDSNIISLLCDGPNFMKLHILFAIGGQPTYEFLNLFLSVIW